LHSGPHSVDEFRAITRAPFHADNGLHDGD
jgi:hypothetical protein